MTKRQYKVLKKLHEQVIHNNKSIKNDREWYRLSRRETLLVDKGGWEVHGKLCQKGCGF